MFNSMKTKNILKTIKKELSTMSNDQIITLFKVYQSFVNDYNIVMSKQSYLNFLVETIEYDYDEEKPKKQFKDFETFLTYVIPKYTSKSKYPILLYIIKMIKKNYTHKKITEIFLNFK